MDLLLICRDGLANSLTSVLLMAMEAKKAGVDVGVIFMQEALRCVAGEGVLRWSPGLTSQELRLKFADVAIASNLPITGGKGEGRELDALALVGQAKEAGVPMFACPLWAGLLGLDKLPEGITVIESSALLKMLQETKQVIGAI